MTETCATCRYWRMAGAGWGRCHRNPPVRASSLDSGWPQANDAHWCGEHRPAGPAEGDEYTRAAVAYAEASVAEADMSNTKDPDAYRRAMKNYRDKEAAFLRLYREREARRG